MNNIDLLLIEVRMTGLYMCLYVCSLLYFAGRKIALLAIWFHYITNNKSLKFSRCVKLETSIIHIKEIFSHVTRLGSL